jgi:hypothetical protein
MEHHTNTGGESEGALQIVHVRPNSRAILHADLPRCLARALFPYFPLLSDAI